MKIYIELMCCEEETTIKIKSRPNKGDGIYLQDFKKLKGLSKSALKSVKNSIRFEVQDVVYGKPNILDDKKLRWFIKGELIQ